MVDRSICRPTPAKVRLQPFAAAAAAMYRHVYRTRLVLLYYQPLALRTGLLLSHSDHTYPYNTGISMIQKRVLTTSYYAAVLQVSHGRAVGVPGSTCMHTKAFQVRSHEFIIPSRSFYIVPGMWYQVCSRRTAPAALCAGQRNMFLPEAGGTHTPQENTNLSCGASCDPYTDIRTLYGSQNHFLRESVFLLYKWDDGTECVPVWGTTSNNNTLLRVCMICVCMAYMYAICRG